MWRWLRPNWGRRQIGAMADLVLATREISPSWQEIKIERRAGGVVFSIVSTDACTVHNLSEQP